MLMPTVLIVDLSGNDLPDLRCWPDVFSSLWEPGDEFLAMGGMTVSTRSRKPELRFALNPFTDEYVDDGQQHLSVSSSNDWVGSVSGMSVSFSNTAGAAGAPTKGC
ncbi:hypothetical protein [Streptomyces sp. NPDC093591]|uniref:hypothetical protein n=1 Tax=Streptomyces sp. NPDC093591 TaxID=3366044 RepID=UPI00382F96D4